MSMTDPIADFLTRIRNATHAAHETTDIPSSRLKREMARILREQGYIEGFEIVPPAEGQPAELIRVRLQYTDDRRSPISGLRRGPAPRAPPGAPEVPRRPPLGDLGPAPGLAPGPAPLRPRRRHPQGPGRH